MLTLAGHFFSSPKLKYLGLIPLLFVLASCGALKCERDSETAVYARSLSAERLSALYDYSMGLEWSDFGGDYYDQVLPEEILDLPIKLLRVKQRSVIYRLEGCMDHHLDLVVIKAGETAAQIELHSGEVPRIVEVLWPK